MMSPRQRGWNAMDAGRQTRSRGSHPCGRTLPTGSLPGVWKPQAATAARRHPAGVCESPAANSREIGTAPAGLLAANVFIPRLAIASPDAHARQLRCEVLDTLKHSCSIAARDDLAFTFRAAIDFSQGVRA